MPTYECYYAKGDAVKIYKVDNPRAAYKAFIEEVDFRDEKVFVAKEYSFAKAVVFDDHSEFLKKKQQAEKELKKELSSKRNAKAKEGCDFLNKNNSNGFFKLTKNQKINLQNLFKEIINYSLNEALLDGEIEFLHLWNNFKDRHFGQTLIAQNEAQKPPSERGQSELANTIVSGIAMGNLIKANQLNEMREMNETMDEMAEDVEDVNEGFGFDE